MEMHLLQTENEVLRGVNVMQSNELKTLKFMQSSKTEEKESHIKEIQNKLHQANKIAADKTKELSKLKRDIFPKEQDIMLSWGIKNPSLRIIKNDIASTQNERNHEIDSLTSNLEAFKQFITEELFSFKTCVETVKNSRTHQNSETTDKQKSLNRRQDQSEKYHQHQNMDKRRPLPVINQYPENQTTFTKITPQHGPTSYSGTIKLIKKIALLCISIPKPLTLYHIKKKLGHNEIYKKAFPGVNANRLNHQIIPALSEDKPVILVIHVGVNDIMNRTDSDDLILQIGRIGVTCKNYGVKNNFHLSIYKRNKK